MMLGLLLARSGVRVVVLEKHADFLRDFRGDTLHPSTLEVMHELGLAEGLLAKPHQQLSELRAMLNGEQVTIADFSRLKTRYQFIAFMPQWDFLDYLAEAARRYPEFQLQMQAEATDLLFDGQRVVGVEAHTPGGPLEVRAELVVAADGRGSVVRQRAGLAVRDYGVPIDVLWMRIPKGPDAPSQSLGYFRDRKMMVLLDRGNYFQCGYIIGKGQLDAIQAQGLPALRTDIVSLAPFLASSIDALDDWEQVKLLTVKIDRLVRWYRQGLLAIGDAAHAMSPAGGVGINLALQDAVAAANILAPAFARGEVGETQFAQLQRRREWPTRLVQSLQAYIHDRTFGPGAARRPLTGVPLPFRLVRRFPILRRLVARLVGIGIRPEHVHTPDVHRRQS